MRNHYHIKRSGIFRVWYVFNRGRIVAACRHRFSALYTLCWFKKVMG